jgi:hypothetical protein
MLSIHKINPMVRAIGTMGAVVALVGGITYAATGLQSQTVKLSPNNLVTASAGLYIGAATVDTSTCGSVGGGDTTVTPGFTTATPLVPGGSPVNSYFCFDNTGDVPLLVTASIPSLPTGTAANNITLNVTCTAEGALSLTNSTLSSWSGGTFTTALPAGEQDTCTASATLSNSYSGTGGETVPSFDIDFVGNQAPTT